MDSYFEFCLNELNTYLDDKFGLSKFGILASSKLVHIFYKNENDDYHKSILTRNKFIENVMNEIVELLKIERIDFVFLKGILLGKELYPEPYMRPTLDIDILLPIECLDKALKLFELAGFIDESGNPYSKDSVNFRGSEKHIAPLYKNYEYFTVSVELHIHVEKYFGRLKRMYGIDLFCEFSDDITSRIIERSIYIKENSSYGIRILNRADNFILNAEHSVSEIISNVFMLYFDCNYKARPFNLRGIFDLMLMLTKYDDIWDEVFGVLQEYSREVIWSVYLASVIINNISNKIINEDVLRRIRYILIDADNRNLIEVISANLIQDVPNIIINKVDFYNILQASLIQYRTPNIKRLPYSVYLDRHNCSVFGKYIFEVQQKDRDHAKLSANIDLSKIEGGIHFEIRFCDKELFMDQNKENFYQRMHLQIMFLSDNYLDSHRINIVLGDNGGETVVCIKQGEVLGKESNFTGDHSENNLRAAFNLSYKQLGLPYTVNLSKAFFMIGLYHINKDFEYEYSLFKYTEPIYKEYLCCLDIS